MTSNSGMAFDDAMDLAESMDLPDGAFWAMAHDLAGLDYGCGFPAVPTKRPKRRAAVHAQLMEPRNAAKPHRCGAMHGQAHPTTGSLVVLTTAHLDHTPENCDDASLLAMCQQRHLRYDRHHHASTARRTRDAKAGQTVLPLGEIA